MKKSLTSLAAIFCFFIFLAPSCNDSDGDGVPDNVDSCPEEVGIQRDTDQDGLGDVCDNCPFEANADQADDDNDDIGNACEADVDDDGDWDDIDNCKDVANPDQADQDSDGNGDACDNCPTVPNGNVSQFDTDEDGLGNFCDNCPYVANLDQTDSDNDGQGDACQTFYKEVGSGNYDFLLDVDAANEGVVTCGRYNLGPSQLSDGWILGYDREGEKLFEKVLYPGDVNMFNACVMAGDSKILAGGSSDGKAWLVDMSWESPDVYSSRYLSGMGIYDILPVFADGLILVGEKEDQTKTAGWIYMEDTMTGDVLIDFSYRYLSYNYNRFNAVVQRSYSEFAAVGYAQDDAGHSVGILVTFDRAGNILKEELYDEGSYTYLTDVAVVGGSWLGVVGASTDDQGWQHALVGLTAVNGDYPMVRVDETLNSSFNAVQWAGQDLLVVGNYQDNAWFQSLSLGNLKPNWEKVYDREGFQQINALDLQDGTFLFAGESVTDDRGWNGVLIKTDTAGNAPSGPVK